MSAADSLWVADYYAQGPRWFFRLRGVQLMISDDHKSLKAAAAPPNILNAVDSSKHRAPESRIAKGADIRILSEEDFLDLMEVA